MSTAATTRRRRPPAPPAESFPHVEAAEAYARAVVAGEVPACRFVILACKRHLEGLEREHDPAYPYRLDRKAAAKVCRFLELLPHVKGKWARERARLKLERWQAFAVVNVFGWKRKADGLRRYREVYIEVPRKNGKSAFTAGIGLYMLTADGEHGAEVYSGATTEKQAWEVFGPARLMAKNTEPLLEAFGVVVGAKNLHVITTASKFEPIIGKPGDGASPSFSITDEYHEHQTADQYDTMVTGMGAREQPIAWVITTAGADTAGPCYAQRMKAADTLEGKVENDELFALIFTLDDGDDWTAEAALWKANPNMGVSVFADFLRGRQRDAIANPRDQSTFKTKHLNLWVTAAAPFFNLEQWTRLGDPTLTLERVRHLECVGALDLASKLDIAARLFLFWELRDGLAHYYAIGRFYLPKARADDPRLKHYAGWVKQGHLVATPGNVTDYNYIEADLKADAERVPLLEIGADPHNATQLITRLGDHLGHDRVVEIPQTVAHLSEPMKEAQAVIVDGRIHHDGNPVLTWMIGNVTAQEDRNQNVFPRKEGPERKIDGAVALIIAMGCALRQQNKTKGGWLL